MRHLSSTFGRSDQGMTLVELLIALALVGLVVGGLTTIFVTQRKAATVQGQVTAMTQQAQAALELITRELRTAGTNSIPTAGTNSTGATFTPVTYSPTQLEIRTDLNDRNGTNDPDEHVIYAYDATRRRITRDTGSGAQPVVENIQAFTFTYLDSAGNPTTISSAIRQLQITITARTAAADPQYTANHGYRTATLRSLIALRNWEIRN